MGVVPTLDHNLGSQLRAMYSLKTPKNATNSNICN
jgi:hypothetical protein